MTGPRDAAHSREVVGRTTTDSIMRSGGGAGALHADMKKPGRAAML
jgi:hypothetical protein